MKERVLALAKRVCWYHEQDFMRECEGATRNAVLIMPLCKTCVCFVTLFRCRYDQTFCTGDFVTRVVVAKTANNYIRSVPKLAMPTL